MIASRAIAVSIAHPAAVRLQRPARPMQRPARPLHRPAMPLRRPVSRQQTRSLLPAAIFVLKLVAAALAGATATLVLWQDDRKPVAQYSLKIRSPRHGRPSGSPGERRLSQRAALVQRRLRGRIDGPCARAGGPVELSRPGPDGELHAARGSAATATHRQPARRSCRERARRQAAAISDRNRGAGAGTRRRGDRGRLQRGAGEARHQHRLLQPVRRAQHPALRSLSAHLRHGGPVQRGPDRPARAGLGEESARAVRAAQEAGLRISSSSTIRTPIRSRT